MKVKNNATKGSMATGIFLLLPGLLLIVFTISIPTVWNILLSFQKWDGFLNKEWIGLGNYIEMLSDKYAILSIKNSVILGLSITFFSVVIGVFVAVLIFRLGRGEGAFYRLILFMPVMLPVVIIGLLFTFIYNPEMGLLNNLLKVVGLGDWTNAWLGDPNTVLNCIIIVGVWRMFGLTMMLSYAAIQSIPNSLLEASKIEGASYIKQLTTIILPLIKPIIRMSAVFSLALSFKSYDLVYVLTAGGPARKSMTVPIYMINTGFTYNEFGYSASLGVVITIIVMLIVLIVSKVLRSDKYEY